MRKFDDWQRGTYTRTTDTIESKKVPVLLVRLKDEPHLLTQEKMKSAREKNFQIWPQMERNDKKKTFEVT